MGPGDRLPNRLNRVKQNPFIRLIQREATIPLRRLALTAAVAGLANVLVLVIVNGVARELGGGSSGRVEATSGQGEAGTERGEAGTRRGEAGTRRDETGTGRETRRDETGTGRETRRDETGTGRETRRDETGTGRGEAGSGSEEISGTGERTAAGIGDFLGFLVVVLVYAFAQRYTVVTAARAVEDAVRRVRERLARKIAACELAAFEKVGRGPIYSCLSRDTEVLSESSVQLINGVQQGVLVIFIGIYLAFVSWLAFALVLVFNLVSSYLILRTRKTLTANMHAAAMSGSVLLEATTHVLDGFKEIKLNNLRRDRLLEDVDSVSLATRDSKLAARRTLMSFMVLTQMSFYMLLGVVIFVVPRFNPSFADQVVQISTAVLFIMMPIISFTGSIAVLETVNRAAQSVARIEQILDDNASASLESAEGAAPALESLGFHDLEFDYRDAEGAPLFSMGPLSLEIAEGETVFFVGGNGSGKSTLLKLLTSLYEPRSGSLLADGSPVVAENRQSLREQIGAVFSDFHLFNRLYGLQHVDDAKANQMIDFLGLGGKTRVEDGQFETLELSGGQRKRLGLLVALLEDRPVLVLDEVAADQDPDFRRRFYHELLPELQRAGKTLLLATHDDLYFPTADRLVVLDEGKIREIVEPPKKV